MLEQSAAATETPTIEALGRQLQENSSEGQAQPQAQEQEPKEDLASKYDQKLADLTSKFDGLSRRERSLLQKEREIQEKAQRVEEFESLKALAKKDPAQLMEKFGLTYDQLTDYYAGLTPEDETKKTVGSLKSEIEELKKQIEIEKSEGQAKEIAKVKQHKIEALKNLANKEDSEYGLISSFGSYDDVLQHMADHYQATGEILDDQSAMDAIEKQLEQNLKELAKSPKVRQLLGIGERSETPPEVQEKTMTLADNFGSEAPRTADTRRLSEQQLFELALSKMPSLG